jgi:hypothetical protein
LRIRRPELVIAAALPFLAPGCGGTVPPVATGAVVTLEIPSDHRIGGTATGIPPGTGIAVADAAAGRVVVLEDGPFAFERRLVRGTPYAVTIEGIVQGQYCSLANASGVMPGSDVTSIVLACRRLGSSRDD